MPKLFIKTLNAITTVSDDDLLVISDTSEEETLKITIGQIKATVFGDIPTLDALSADDIANDDSLIINDDSASETKKTGVGDLREHLLEDNSQYIAQYKLRGREVFLWNNKIGGGNAEYHLYNNGGVAEWLIGQASGSSHNFRVVKKQGTTRTTYFTIDTNGDVDVVGAFSKGSGSFKITHPLLEKAKTHNLVHSFIEGPQADNIYRGKVELASGAATINIDTAAGMTEGTFAALNREVQCFTTNETGWTAVKGSVTGNILTITAQEHTCADTISWLVIGERQDQHMYNTSWTDDNGKVIVEPLKSSEPESP